MEINCQHCVPAFHSQYPGALNRVSFARGNPVTNRPIVSAAKKTDTNAYTHSHMCGARIKSGIEYE